MAYLHQTRRIKQVPAVFLASSKSGPRLSFLPPRYLRRFTNDSGDRLNNRVTFGDVNIDLKDLAPVDSPLIPSGAADLYFGSGGLRTREIFGHLRWIAQK